MNLSNDYDAQAIGIKMEEITSCDKNAKMLRRLMDNDADFTKVIVGRDEDLILHDHHVYTPTSVREVGWLGYFIGTNTHLQQLSLFSDDFDLFGVDSLEQFCSGLGRNKSIKEIIISGFSGIEAALFEMLIPFFKNNRNLTDLLLINCHQGAEECRLISSALAECSKSLKRFAMAHYGPGRGGQTVGGGPLSDIVAALSMHPQLRGLRFHNANVGRRECTALATLLRRTATGIDALHLGHNDIDDEGVEALVDALASGNKLRTLNLAHNRSITARGCRAVATLLASPSSNLEILHLADIGRGVNEEGLSIFAGALTRNSKLKELILSERSGKLKGWNTLLKLLCDPSSVDSTLFSNHTLRAIWGGAHPLPKKVDGYLKLNRNDDKNRVALIKIMINHRQFDMRPLFRWEFKALPFVVSWFEMAARHINDVEVGRRKLSSVYQFVRGMPMLYVESRINR